MLQPGERGFRGGQRGAAGVGPADQGGHPLPAAHAQDLPRGQAALVHRHPADPHRAARGAREDGDRHLLQRHSQFRLRLSLCQGLGSVLGWGGRVVVVGGGGWGVR